MTQTTHFGHWNFGHCLGFGAPLSRPFLKSVENLLDLFPPAKFRRQQLNLSLAVHLQSQGSILKKISGFGFKLQNKAELVNSALRFDRIQKSGVENGNILLPGFEFGVHGQNPQRIHDPGDIDVIRASDTTAITRSAHPDRFRGKNPLPVAVLNMTEDLVGKDVHGVSDRTARRALLALITGLDGLTAGLSHF